MKISLAKFSLLLCGWLTLFAIASSDAPPELWAQNQHSQNGEELFTPAEARERWDSLSSEQQERLRHRFVRLQSLDASERAELTRRAAVLKREEARLLKRLSPENRHRLREQPPAKRRELIEEIVEAERRERGARIEGMLPEKTRDWLRDCPPAERRKRLEHFRRITRERISARAVEDLAEALGYGEDEVRRLERLPIEERMKVVMVLWRKLDERERADGDLLREFTQEMWSDLEGLTADDYFVEVQRLRHEGGIRNLSPHGRAERQDRREARARERQLTSDLRRNLRIQPDELVDLSVLSHEDRRREINQRRRRRLVATLREHSALTEHELEGFASLPDEELFRRARLLADRWAEREGEEGASSETREPAPEDEVAGD